VPEHEFRCLNDDAQGRRYRPHTSGAEHSMEVFDGNSMLPHFDQTSHVADQWRCLLPPWRSAMVEVGAELHPHLVCVIYRWCMYMHGTDALQAPFQVPVIRPKVRKYTTPEANFAKKGTQHGNMAITSPITRPKLKAHRAHCVYAVMQKQMTTSCSARHNRRR
jgi:hypothetical protein